MEIKEYRTIYPAIVDSVDDSSDSWRIRCVISDLRDDMLKELPYCYPLLGKDNGKLPKKGEVVMVILGNLSKPTEERYWISRQISQFDKVSGEFGISSVMRGTIHSRLSYDRAVSQIPTAKGLYPNTDEFRKYSNWFLGNNSDVIASDNLLELRVGKHKKDKPLERNTVNPSLIRMEYNSDNETTLFQASNKIMLISHSQTPKANIDLNEDRLNTLFEKLSPMVKGDVFIELFTLFYNAFKAHSHQYHNLPPNPSELNYQRLENYDFQKILSDNIRIN